jgi:glyoxylase-like metal-dependent hydrolase (beta-lactamase superfamily II)
MRLVPLEHGRLHVNMRAFTGEKRDGVLPVPSWLIEHPDGLVLFDAGLHGDLQRSSDRLGDLAGLLVIDFPEGEDVAARLAEREIRASDVTHVVFSHLHFDHAGGTHQLPDARLVVQQAEWDAGCDDADPNADIYNRDDFDLGHEVERIDGVHDVFGDGRIVCVPTPGHTAGHQSLRVELESGPVVLTSDCVYVASMLDDMIVPRFGFDFDQQRASMRELQRLRDTEGCRLLFGHDEDQFRSLPDVLT